MTEVQARSLVAGVALIICAVIAALIWGGTAVNVVLALAVLWLIADRVGLHERVDETSDRADRATEGLEDVTNHLWGLQPAGKGKHREKA